MNEILLAGFLGIIEGLTEFIPVSSTGHLIVASKILKFDNSNFTFEIFIQLGAILAALFYYKKDIKEYFFDFNKIANLILAMIPASIVGFIFHKDIKRIFFNPASIACFLILGAIFLFFAQKVSFKSDKINKKNALVIGLFQCLSLLPGFSRSGSCIIAGLSQGIDKKQTTDFSFILGIPMIALATAYELYKGFNQLNVSDLPVFFTGFITSFIFGYMSIKFFINFLSKYSLNVFIIYRIILGIFILLFI